MIASWLDHLGQHQRATNVNRIVQGAVSKFGAAVEPKVTHFIAADFRLRRTPRTEAISQPSCAGRPERPDLNPV